MIQCDKCADFVEDSEVNPISPSEGVWCNQCCEGQLGSRDLAHEILAGHQRALDGVALRRMAVTLIETLKLSEEQYHKLLTIRNVFKHE